MGSIYIAILIILILMIFHNILYLYYRNFKYKIKEIKDEYGYKNNKVIDIDNVPIFRGVPCDKNIYYAYILIKLNKFKFENVNLLSAIILKWIKENKIEIEKDEGVQFIDLRLNPKFVKDSFEDKLFKMMYEASNNGLLEINEFKEWAKNYDMRFLGLFAKLEVDMINYLKKKTHIYYRITEEECLYDYVMDDKIYQDSLELYGLKKYLDEFSILEKKKIIDLKLWDDYLIFATLFGISDSVFKEFKKILPDVEKIDIYDLI